jgi:hypothetical protein
MILQIKNSLHNVHIKFKVWNIVSDMDANPNKNTDFLTINDGSVVRPSPVL